MTAAATDPWDIVAYEVRMFRATYAIMLDPVAIKALSKVFANAVEESAVLHTRILCDVFLSNSGGRDDIQLTKLFSNWRHGRYDKLRQRIAELRTKYGNANIEATPCWIFNKMLAHPTTHRGVSYDYTSTLRDIEPTIKAIIVEIETLRGTSFTWTW